MAHSFDGCQFLPRSRHLQAKEGVVVNPLATEGKQLADVLIACGVCSCRGECHSAIFPLCLRSAMPDGTTPPNEYDGVIIGTGFGGTISALTLADRLKGTSKRLLMIERGTWWTTPVSTVQDKNVKTRDFIARKNQPVQFWSSQNYFMGLVDLFTRCLRRTADDNVLTRLFPVFRNEDGLFDLTRFGTKGFLGLFGGKSDGITVIRASGVGGGSLVYSNITIRPPDFIFDDWPLHWTAAERQMYFDLARHAIGYGIVSAWRAREAHNLPYEAPTLPPGFVNPGLSNILARSARIDPHWHVRPDANNARGVKQIVINPPLAPGGVSIPDRSNALWIDRARVFQTALKDLTPDFGAVDLAISDVTPEVSPLAPPGTPHNYPLENSVNYCERQGRCNVGCLPGARYTLNKQLMRAILGKFDPTDPDNPAKDAPPEFPNLSLEPLAEVDVIEALADGGYEVRYVQRNLEDQRQTTVKRIRARVVIVAAGCLGTSEIMLRCRAKNTLPHLSAKVGDQFSTNGDYLAFLSPTKDRVSLIRGPVTTSCGHFNTTEAGTGPDPNTPPDPALFHTLEDQGIPPALASVVGEGLPLIKAIGNGSGGIGFVFRATFRYLKKRAGEAIRQLLGNPIERKKFFQSEEEIAANMMCVVAMGREGSRGRFRLAGSSNESPLRVARTDGKPFEQDPIYDAIRHSLGRLADKLRQPGTSENFQNPFLTGAANALAVKSIALSHPLGGCPMGRNATEGVVDELGRVFDTSKTGDRPFYEGLYIADASIIPSALGVNPSLTISALALRIAENLIAEQHW
jgi:choline dehydrogenase-like flavoprotein